MHTYGKLFRIHTWGTSHSPEIGVVIDGVPLGLSLSESDFLGDLKRRQAGEIGTTPRVESDIPEITSGIYNGFTTGAPLHIIFKNKQQNSADYKKRRFPRPGHADFAASVKYQSYENPEGGGFFSGRMTVLLVAAGVVAKKVLDKISIHAEILNIGGKSDYLNVLHETICEKDSLGACIRCSVIGLPAGVGEPVFDSVESVISHLIFAIPGAKAIAFGSGMIADSMKGSEYNDCILDATGKTETNHSGGINGGISNGNPVVFDVNFKPTSSIGKPQKTYNPETDAVEKLVITGKHDVCYALRTPVIVEASAAIAILDLCLQHKTRLK